MPAFPHLPKEGDRHYLRFLAEVLWWAITAVWLIVRRLPRWLRIFLGFWVVLTLVSRCERSPSRKDPVPGIQSESTTPPATDTGDVPEKPDGAGEIKSALAAAASELRKESIQAPGNSLAANLTRIGAEIAAGVAQGIPDAPGAPVRVAVASFTPDAESGPGHEFGLRLRTALLGELPKAPEEGSPSTTRIAPSELPLTEAGRSDPELVLIARNRGFRYVVRATPESVGGATVLLLRLIATVDGRTTWTQSVPISSDAPPQSPPPRPRWQRRCARPSLRERPPHKNLPPAPDPRSFGGSRRVNPEARPVARGTTPARGATRVRPDPPR
jgi:hypothetical protein